MDVITEHITKLSGILIFILVFSFGSNAQEFSDGYISAMVMHQKAVAPGDTMPITIKIIKNDISGFAKFKCIAPHNFQILSPDFVNASATLKDSILEVIWVEIPFEKEFLIDYKLVIPNTAPLKSFSFSGSFYYLIDKDIKVLKFQNISFDITDDKVALKNSETEFKTQAIKREKNTQTVLQPKDDRAPIPTIDSNAISQPTISNLTEVPAQPVIEDKKSQEPELKIPTEDTLKADTLVKELQLLDSSIVKTDTVAEPKKAEEKPVEIQQTQVEPPKIEDSKIEEPKPEPVVETPKVEEPAKEQPVAKQVEKPSSNGTGLEFRLQIAASRKRMTPSQINHIYKGKQSVEENYRGDGWYRYSIAKSSSYSDVKNAKKHCDVADAFITASNNGVAMTVAEALRNAKPNEEKSYGKIFYAVQAIALNNYIPISEFKRRFNTDKLIFVEKDNQYYKYLMGYFFSFREANEYRISLGGDAFVVSYMNGKRLDKAQGGK